MRLNKNLAKLIYGVTRVDKNTVHTNFLVAASHQNSYIKINESAQIKPHAAPERRKNYKY